MTQFEEYKQGVQAITPQEAVRLAQVLPFTREYVEKAIKGLENRTFSALDNGKLTADGAFEAVLEWKTLRRMLMNLETRVQMASENLKLGLNSP